MAVKEVTIPDLGTVNLYKRRGLRSIRLSVTHQGSIRVSMPHWVPYSAGIEFAKTKREWLKSQQIVTLPLRHGGRIGKAHTISFIAEPTRTAIATRVTNGGEVRIYHPTHMLPVDSAVQKAAARASSRALKLQAERLLPQRLQTLAAQHDFSYGSVSIKQLKSRWGSCSNQQDITLNSFLMQLPWHLIDYVLLHELTHTRVMAHGPVFWEELGKYIPNLKALRKEIKAYRPALLTN